MRKSLNFIRAACRPSPLPPPPPPSPPRPPLHPQPRARSQWALPGFNRERQISVGTAGPQLRPPDLSGYSQTPRAPDHSGHCHSLSNGEGPSQLVRAFAELSRSFRGFSGRIYRNVNNISVWIQIHLRTLSINIHLKLKTRILMDFEP